jgi:hypothetical protein
MVTDRRTLLRAQLTDLVTRDNTGSGFGAVTTSRSKVHTFGEHF